MEPSTTPPPPVPQELSCSSTLCSAEIFGTASSSDPAEASGSLTRHITSRSPQSNTEIPFSPLNTGLTRQILVPERITSADLSSDARPSILDAAGGASVDEVTLWDHPPALGEDPGTSAGPMPCRPASPRVAAASTGNEEGTAITKADNNWPLRPVPGVSPATSLLDLPNEVLLQILRYLDVCDLLCTSRTSHLLRSLSLAPILHSYRLRHTRVLLPPLLTSPFRPSLADLMRRSIFLTRTTVVSRQLARSLVCIRLSRRLVARPSVEVLVQRSILPPEVLPRKGDGGRRRVEVAPALVAKKRAVERERVKDELRRWVDKVWRGRVKEREEGVRRWEERVGVGRVWRLRRFWEGVGRM